MKVNALKGGPAPEATGETPDKGFKLIPPLQTEDYSEQFEKLEEAIKKLKDEKLDMDIFEARMAQLENKIPQEEKTHDSIII